MREIREVRGLNQEAFGAIARVTRNTQFNYESGKRAPDTDYLAALRESGFDVVYILTGQRDSGSLSADEKALLHRFRGLPDVTRMTLLALVEQMSAGGMVQAQALHAPKQAYRVPDEPDTD